MNFEFATAGRIVFGAGASVALGRIGRQFGSRALLVAGRNVSRAEPARAHLAAAGCALESYCVVHEPTISDVAAGVALARTMEADVVIGYGGGSVIDAAKAIAVLVKNPEPIETYLEVIGAGRPLPSPGLPCIAVPTTAGTGAEVTRNAVLTATVERVKVSLRSAFMLPKVALVDPALTYDLPPALTASTGLDALTQLIEPYVSCRANPMTDALCVDGLRRAARSLGRAVDDGNDAAAREDMAIASLYGGLALANAGLGAVHGFAAPIGGAFAAAHGAVCAALLPQVVAANVRILRARLPEAEALRRYDELGRLLTGRPGAAADDAIRWLDQLVTRLGVPRLSAHGLTLADCDAMVAAALKASSMKGNPVPLTPEECADIYRQAL